MNGHLSDEQWAAAVFGENDEAAAKHLAECATCPAGVSRLAAATNAARARRRQAAEQPEAFWQRQREAIRARLAEQHPVQPWRRWIWATATVVLILAASALLSHNHTPPARAPAPADPDDALLLNVQQSIRSDLPQALRPAALLTEEMNRAAAARSNF
jgi:hypothetical protein